MKTHLYAVAFVALAAPALAQPMPDHRHHGAPQAQTAPTPTPSTSTPQAMPEQCRAMMQSMPQSCRDMMQQMMQGGGMMHQNMQGSAQSSAPGAATSPAAQAYVAAMDRMHGPMMQAAEENDPDVAFVKGMIPHHQGAIDMAKIVLQYGKDEQTKKWANDVIREQQREIGEMQAWLKTRGR